MQALVEGLLRVGGPVGAVLVAVIIGFFLGRGAAKGHVTALTDGYEAQLAELRREIVRLEARDAQLAERHEAPPHERQESD